MCDYIEYFIDDNYLCVLMEYFEGIKLSDLINERKEYIHKIFRNNMILCNLEIINFFTQIALAIRHLHTRNIIHKHLTTEVYFFI